jgi:hypothetical protein
MLPFIGQQEERSMSHTEIAPNTDASDNGLAKNLSVLASKLRGETERTPNKMMAVAASAVLTLAMVLPAAAQGATFEVSSLYSASAGGQGNTTAKTGATAAGVSQASTTGVTGTQRIASWRIPVVSTKGLTPVFGLVGYQSIVNRADYVDSPNMSDSYSNYAASQMIVAEEQANGAQDNADAASTAAMNNSMGTPSSGDAAGF